MARASSFRSASVLVKISRWTVQSGPVMARRSTSAFRALSVCERS